MCSVSKQGLFIKTNVKVDMSYKNVAAGDDLIMCNSVFCIIRCVLSFDTVSQGWCTFKLYRLFLTRTLII